jgi:hypothetical protein
MNSSIPGELFRFVRVKANLDENIGIMRMHEEVCENDQLVTDLHPEYVHPVISPCVPLKMEEVILPKTNLAPALPIEILEQGLLEPGFSERDVRSLFERTECPTIPFRSRQLCLLRDSVREVTNHPVSARDLAKLFKMNKRTVCRTLRQSLQQPGPLGRHNALDDESEQELVAMLLEAFRAAAPMNEKQLLHIVQERYRKTATRSGVNAFIGRHLDALHTCRSIPQGDTRLAIRRSQLEEHLHIPRVHLTGKCAELVFNPAELGSADWQDRKMKKVIAHAAVRKEDVHHSV